jgi:hypothetical protein
MPGKSPNPLGVFIPQPPLCPAALTQRRDFKAARGSTSDKSRPNQIYGLDGEKARLFARDIAREWSKGGWAVFERSIFHLRFRLNSDIEKLHDLGGPRGKEPCMKIKWSIYLAPLALAVLGLFSVACQTMGGSRYIIPDMPTAQEQFNLAEVQYQKSRGYLPEDLRRQSENEARAAYDAVLKRFPEDMDYTPLAKLRLAFLDKFQGRARKSLRQFETLAESYPDNDVVYLNSVFQSAAIYDDLKDYAKAQANYRLASSPRFLNNKDPEIQRLARYADVQARRIRPSR